ncbi:glycosyltransferase [Flavitalea sp.]|nr:glycosyltransferase [Flavitalea sp.]
MDIVLKGKRLLICEEALTNYKGHFYSWIKAIRRIHLDACAEVIVAGNVNVNDGIQKEFQVHKVYTHNNWSGIYDYKQSWRRYAAVFMHNYRIYNQTRKLLKETGPVDCVILTAVRIHQLLAWQRLCKKRLGKDFQRVVIFILTSEAIYDENYTGFHFKKSSLLIKKVLQGFKEYVDKGQVILAGDSHITCKEYELLSGVPFRVFPSPAAGLEASARTIGKLPKADTKITFVILGVSVIDKGIDLLQKAILKLLNEDPDLEARFIIQWSTPTIDYDGRPVPIDPALRKANQVQILEQVLDENEYRDYLQMADFVVLPYRRVVYFNRLSGVAIEAACAGIPMIVTENTWLAWAMNEFGAGVTIKDGSSEDLADKINYCLNNHIRLKQLAIERQDAALKYNATESYLQAVWS